MRSTARFSLGLVALFAFVSASDAATISGTVAGPDAAPFRGAFVQARNAKTRITVSVLSDKAGHYRLENLPAGDYPLQVRAPGLKAAPKSGVNPKGEESPTPGFAPEK